MHLTTNALLGMMFVLLMALATSILMTEYWGWLQWVPSVKADVGAVDVFGSHCSSQLVALIVTRG